MNKFLLILIGIICMSATNSSAEMNYHLRRNQYRLTRLFQEEPGNVEKGLRLIAVASKEIYKKDETIDITYTIENLSNEAKKYWLEEDSLSFVAFCDGGTIIAHLATFIAGANAKGELNPGQKIEGALKISAKKLCPPYWEYEREYEPDKINVVMYLASEAFPNLGDSYVSRPSFSLKDITFELVGGEKVAKSDLSGFASIRGTILDPNKITKDSIWEEVSPSEVRLKPNIDLKKDAVREIAKDDFNKVWAILQHKTLSKTVVPSSAPTEDLSREDASAPFYNLAVKSNLIHFEIVNK